MSSQIINTSSVERLSSLSDTEFQSAFKEIHPDLLIKLKSEPKDSHIPVIKAFEQFFKRIDLNIEDHGWRQILKDIVSALTYCFSQNLTDAKNLQWEKNVGMLKCTLRENTYILSSLDVLIIALNSIQDINIQIIPTVPKDMISVMLYTFEYCRCSDSSMMAEEVTLMFKACYDLLCHYLTFFNKVKINCQYEADFSLLVEVLEKMYEIGAIAISLDLRTMAELWKGFTQILKSYAAFLRNEFDISKIIRFLIKRITEQVTSLYESSDEKLFNLTSKISAFLLKIVVKLCECFADCFGDCSQELFEFALFLYKHSRCLGTLGGVNADIVRKIDTQLLPGIDPLITVLIDDRQFVKYYLNLELSRFKDASDKAAFLLIVSLILKKLLSCSKEVLELWMKPGFSILHFVFNVISSNGKELCYDVTVSMPCLDATISQEVYLYDALLVHFSSLIVNEVSCDEFSIVEDLLVSNLLHESPSVNLFVGDLWCILARYGNSELCFQHVTFLVSFVKQCRNPVHKVHLMMLVKRLFSFLSSNHQLKILDGLQMDETFIFCYNTMTVESRAQISQKIISNGHLLETLLRFFAQKLESESYHKHLVQATAISNLEPQYLSNQFISALRTFIVETWQRLNGKSIGKLNLRDFKSCIVTLVYLSSTTCSILSHLISPQISIILQSVSDLIKSESVYIKLCCLRVLKNFGNHQIESHMNEISNLFASSFSSLLQDSNPIIKQTSFDTFLQFSLVTKYENIISLTTSIDKTIAFNVATYLKRNPSPLLRNKNLYQFLDTLVTYVVSSSRIENDNEDDNQSPIKRIRLQDDFSCNISQIETGVNGLLRYVETNQLDTQQRKDLRRILNCVEKLKIY